MVALNEPKDDGRKVAGAICPGCDKHYMYPTVSHKEPDKYGRELRVVYGWCLECDIGYNMLQFKSGEEWLTYKYQKYIYNKNTGPKPVSVGPWVKGFSLPQVAALITGPGGDFTKKVDIDAEIEKTLQAAATLLNKAAKNMLELMKIVKEKSGSKNG